mmetsp:Transcript_100237/g.178235  ORF Transcript_100237/g.178235 Transcript_100237/m.178235 type:complete len:98 (+) Transcript_100237:40-333(+)
MATANVSKRSVEAVRPAASNEVRTPELKSREERLRAVWGPSGEPGAPRKPRHPDGEEAFEESVPARRTSRAGPSASLIHSFEDAAKRSPEQVVRKLF